MYKKTILKNGVRIVTEKIEHFRSVSLGIWVGTGSRAETEQQNGISHFIEHMIFKGTKKRDSLRIAKDLDIIGGLSNAFTGKELTCFHSRVLDKHFTILAEILTDIFLNSVFDPMDINRERQVILQEIGMVEDTPDEYIHELFNDLFWRNHPLGMSVLGTQQTVSSIDRDAIIGYLEKSYTPDRIIIALAGNIEHNEVVDFFSPLFEAIRQTGPRQNDRIPHINSDISCNHKRLEQVHICLGGIAPHLSSDLRFAGAVLNTLLGGNMSSRLFQEIREKRGLAYSIYSFLTAYIDAGILGICLGTDQKEVNTCLSVIKNEIDKIKKGEISEAELKAAKEHLNGGILLSSENTDSRMTRLAKNEYVFDRYVSYEELIEELEKVTVDNVISCAKDSFHDDNVALTTLGPFRRKELDIENIHFA